MLVTLTSARRAASRLARHASGIPTPPLPSPADNDLNRTGAISAEVDPFSSRKLQGKGGAYRGKDVVPMWIADMDFRAPLPVVDAIVKCAARGIYGYTNCPPRLTELAIERLASVYGSTEPPQAEWLTWLPGLVPGLNHAVRATCTPAGGGGGVVVLSPAYPPFLHTPGLCGATLLDVPLLPRAAGEGEVAFEIDWEALERALSPPSTKLLLLCNPHNPSGRCWPRDDLSRLLRLCVDHGVTVCSDEVWGELPLEPSATPFTSALALASGPASVPGLRERLIVLTSPSKCFNVATLDIALAAVPDGALREAFRRAGAETGTAEVPPFGYFGAEACYGDGESEAWRRRLVAYLAANRDAALAALAAVPGLRATRPESSYLMWVDATACLPPGASAAELLLQHGVGVSDGGDFGGAPGCFRLNFACRRETLERGLARVVAALQGAGRDPS